MIAYPITTVPGSMPKMIFVVDVAVMVIFTRLMKRARTIKSWISYVLAPVLLIVLSISVYRQIIVQPDLPQALDHIRRSFFSPSIGWLIAALVGTFANWGLEALKWKRLLRNTETVSFSKAFKGVLTGVSFTLFTPNRIGEYLGRIWHLDAKSRGAAVSLSIAGSVAQLFVTCLFGMIAAEFLWRGGFRIPVLPDQPFALIILKIIGWSMTALLLLIYFSVGDIGLFLSRIQWLRSIHSWLQVLSQLSMRDLRRILGLSVLRYLVFLIQYYLIFQFFGVALPMEIAFLTTALTFLLLALIPGMALAELGVRGQLSIWIVGAFSSNALGIVMAASTVWVINLILPAVVGGILLQLTKKV